MMDQVYQFIPFLQTTGLEMRSILLMIAYSLPQILMLSTPISLMIGITIGIQRICTDHELVVMRGAGISLNFLFKPVLFVAGSAALVVLILAFYLAPMGVTKLEALKFSILTKQSKFHFTENRINNFFNQNVIFFFNKGEKNEMLEQVFIADWKNPGDHSVIEAKKGRISFDKDKKKVVLQLTDGTIHQPAQNQRYRIVDFKHLDYDLAPPNSNQGNLPSRFRGKKKKKTALLDYEMTINLLWKELYSSRKGSSDYYEYSEELHGRIVTILSCIIIAIFALPIGIYDPRNPKTGKFLYLTFMMIVYFSIYFQVRTKLNNGELPPFTLYLPLCGMFLVGMFNFYKLNHDLSSIREFIQLRLQRFKRDG